MKEKLKKEEVVFLGQLVKSLEEAESKLEVAYQDKNSVYFDKLKKFILEIQQKMEVVLK